MSLDECVYGAIAGSALIEKPSRRTRVQALLSKAEGAVDFDSGTPELVAARNTARLTHHDLAGGNSGRSVARTREAILY
jgi:hypothetical protein